MEQKFNNNRLDLQVLREFCEREGEEIAYRKVRKPHENPSIGIVLCKSANQAFAEYAVRDYNKPLGIATYKTFSDMPKEMQQALPDIEELKKLITTNE